ncbi:uroporphyrinogen-III C-methyltransferase [Priestia aryabhattai]|uniref:uroporphyrinogen-III C-methyltransferase n=1 Tax=Priestia TaxID=2800373 RepID=UPI000B9FF293|nr:uroporphyrinogen-III C-methyltransferase [Priestia flexa]MDT2045085.1 uroporphyrinogen-III C-methyltransferase [Priestia flexa]OZT13188.1 uroporphyrinogen-III C-methyltransferase [Priestia aryabhattai]USY54828.1 uroporphyrinogen-III C-methyltransferase [Bacillus sp. 1780r2a1]
MGKVYLVGAGPGDPELVTVKAIKAIQKADVILYDRLVNKELLEYAKSEVNIIYCGKLPNYHTLKQETINSFLVKFAKKGKVVVRLKGGDPFVFGRGGEEAEALVENNIDFEIIPGVTSGIAAASYAGIPVTHRDYSASVAFITGHRQDEPCKAVKWEQLSTAVDTLVIYMGVKNLSYICESLIEHGKSKDTPIALINWGTYGEQRTVSGKLDTIVDIVKKEKIGNPSIIVVGEVVRFHEKLNWFEQLASTQYACVEEA